MLRRSAVYALSIVVVGRSRVEQPKPNAARFPHGMTKEQKLPCVRAASMLLDQPVLTPTQLANGPDFDPADPEKSRFAYFTADDTISLLLSPALRVL